MEREKQLVVSTGNNIVVAANMLGKIKTVSQIVAIVTVFAEPIVQKLFVWIVNACGGSLVLERIDIVPLSWATVIFSLVMTVWSGVNYLKAYWKYLDPEK